MLSKKTSYRWILLVIAIFALVGYVIHLNAAMIKLKSQVPRSYEAQDHWRTCYASTAAYIATMR